MNTSKRVTYKSQLLMYILIRKTILISHSQFQNPTQIQSENRQERILHSIYIHLNHKHQKRSYIYLHRVRFMYIKNTHTHPTPGHQISVFFECHVVISCPFHEFPFLSFPFRFFSCPFHFQISSRGSPRSIFIFMFPVRYPSLAFPACPVPSHSVQFIAHCEKVKAQTHQERERKEEARKKS